MKTSPAPTHTRADTESGIIAGSIAVVAWGLGPLFVKAMDVSTPTTVTYRFLFAVPVMHLVAWLFGGRVTRNLMRLAIVLTALGAIAVNTRVEAVRLAALSEPLE